MRRIIASSQRADTYSIMVEPRPAGVTIGLYRGLPIAERVVDQFDRRFTFAGIIGRRRDGQYDVNALKPGQFVVEPGLVYDLEVGEGREKQEVRAELPPEPQSESQPSRSRSCRRPRIDGCCSRSPPRLRFSSPAGSPSSSSFGSFMPAKQADQPNS